MLEKVDHGHHVLRVYCKGLVARLYEKFSTFLRVEICVNRMKDLGLNKGLDQLDALRQKLSRWIAEKSGHPTGLGIMKCEDVPGDLVLSSPSNHVGRIVTIGPVVLFSTKSGDAWLLDPADHLATPLAPRKRSQSSPAASRSIFRTILFTAAGSFGIFHSTGTPNQPAKHTQGELRRTTVEKKAL
jgi:hypothetical protein